MLSRLLQSNWQHQQKLAALLSNSKLDQYISSILFFPRPIYYIRLLYLSPLLIVVTQIRGHIAGSSPPIHTAVRALHFYREKISALPSSIRVELPW